MGLTFYPDKELAIKNQNIFMNLIYPKFSAESKSPMPSHRPSVVDRTPRSPSGGPNKAVSEPIIKALSGEYRGDTCVVTAPRDQLIPLP